MIEIVGRNDRPAGQDLVGPFLRRAEDELGQRLLRGVSRSPQPRLGLGTDRVTSVQTIFRIQFPVKTRASRRQELWRGTAHGLGDIEGLLGMSGYGPTPAEGIVVRTVDGS